MRKYDYDYTATGRTRMVICVKCGNRRKYQAKDMCPACYADIRNKKRADINNAIF